MDSGGAIPLPYNASAGQVDLGSARFCDRAFWGIPGAFLDILASARQPPSHGLFIGAGGGIAGDRSGDGDGRAGR
jgi:hypothetical protein